METRQTAQAKRLRDGGRFALIILGGAHDLSDNLDRVSGGKAEPELCSPEQSSPVNAAFSV